VCSLPPERLRERLEMIRGEIAPLVNASRELADGREWQFANGSQIKTQLENLIELERQCCGGITFDLRVADAGDRLLLSARGTGAAHLFERAGL
jgi:hypothetical protein